MALLIGNTELPAETWTATEYSCMHAGNSIENLGAVAVR
jgi:hypothetical protein